MSFSTALAIEDCSISNQSIEPRRPRLRYPIKLPEEFHNAMKKLMTDNGLPLVNVRNLAIEMRNRFSHQRIPLEKEEINELRRAEIRRLYEKYRKNQSKLRSEHPIADDQIFAAIDNEADSREVAQLKKLLDDKAYKNLKYLINEHKPLAYSSVIDCLAYGFFRAPADYAATIRVLRELRYHDPHFQPEKVVDFGSGLGTSIWATENVFNNEQDDQTSFDSNYPYNWWTKRQYLCIERSYSMINMAISLIIGGNPPMNHRDFNDAAIMSRILFRAALLKNIHSGASLCLSAFTLLDLESEEERLASLRTLYDTSVNYIVLIERATYSAFTLLNRAREYLLQLAKEEQTELHIVAPCLNELPCPLAAKSHYRSCATPVFYERRVPFTFGEKDARHSKKEGVQLESFCYLILSKVPRTGKSTKLRMVGELKLQHKSYVCRVCTELNEIKTCRMRKQNLKKMGSLKAQLRGSRKGDLLPTPEHLYQLED